MELQYNHPEWEKENSLSSPVDRSLEDKWRPDQTNILLTDEEVKEAMRELNIESVYKFPKIDRTYVDQPPPMQNIGLFSFVPSKGAKPDKDGFYGFAKLRGNFATEIEARQRAEYLIRNVDSYHRIYHTFVGRPFPITCNPNYAAETDEIDIRTKMEKIISEDVQAKREEEKKEMETIMERERKLREESKKVQENPSVKLTDDYDNYITLRVKKAQLTWTYLEHQRKMKEVKDLLIKTREDLAFLDEKYPDYNDKYFEKYMNARKEAGITEDKVDTHNNFIKYMVEDVELDF